MNNILNSAVGCVRSSMFIISPYSMSYQYRTQFLWIFIFILLYCKHIPFLAGLVSQKGSRLALEECLEPFIMTVAADLLISDMIQSYFHVHNRSTIVDAWVQITCQQFLANERMMQLGQPPFQQYGPTCL
jgi:branched-subunit amino acid ABC-type transport system permease component